MQSGTEKQLIDSLFTSGGTVSVIINKIGKRFVDFEFNNKTYRLNAWGVICKGTPIENNKTWWQYACLDFVSNQYNQVVESIINYTNAKYVQKDFERFYRYK